MAEMPGGGAARTVTHDEESAISSSHAVDGWRNRASDQLDMAGVRGDEQRLLVEREHLVLLPAAHLELADDPAAEEVALPARPDRLDVRVPAGGVVVTGPFTMKAGGRVS
jgi:hypothetical protein